MPRNRGRGWYNDIPQHILAGKGVPTKSKDKKEWSNNSDNLPQIEDEYFDFKVHTDIFGNTHFTLGLYDTGGVWLGTKDDMITYLYRLTKNNLHNRFVSAMDKEGISFEDLKPLIYDSLEYDDGFSMITGGGSGRWGNSFDKNDKLKEILKEIFQADKLSKEKINKFRDWFWEEGYEGNHMDFYYMKRNAPQFLSMYKEKINSTLETSEDLEEFMLKLDEEFDEDWNKKLAEWRKQTFREEVYEGLQEWKERWVWND